MQRLRPWDTIRAGTCWIAWATMQPALCAPSGRRRPATPSGEPPCLAGAAVVAAPWLGISRHCSVSECTLKMVSARCRSNSGARRVVKKLYSALDSPCLSLFVGVQGICQAGLRTLRALPCCRSPPGRHQNPLNVSSYVLRCNALIQVVIASTLSEGSR